MNQQRKIRLAAEYGQLTLPPAGRLQSRTEEPSAYPYDEIYRPYIVAKKQESTVHALQLIVWSEVREFEIWGMPYSGMTVWEITHAGLTFSCYGYAVTIEGRGLKQDWRFTEALGKQRVKSICVWNPAIHHTPPASQACITRMIREVEE